jgi:hypothetical protein
MIGRRRSMSKKKELSDHGNPQSPQDEISITRDKLPELATAHTEIPSSQIVHLGKIGSILRIEKLRGAEVISIGIKDKDAIDMFARDSMALLGIPMEKRLIKEVTG